jgi:hypothetical protein
VQISGDYISEHVGVVSPGEVLPQSLSLNVIYTSPEATAAALSAAASLAKDMKPTIHVRAMISVARQHPIDYAFGAVQAVTRILIELLQRVGNGRCRFVLHVYICRNRMDTLLTALRPCSLLVIGGRKRLWPTLERRIARIVRTAGHSVAFVDDRATGGIR